MHSFIQIILDKARQANPSIRDQTDFDLGTVVVLLDYLRTFLVGIAAFNAIMGTLLVGYQYFTAFGDEAKAAAAKKTLYWIIIGMIVIIMSEVIVYEMERVVIGTNSQPVPIQQTTSPFTSSPTTPTTPTTPTGP